MAVDVHQLWIVQNAVSAETSCFAVFCRRTYRQLILAMSKPMYVHCELTAYIVTVTEKNVILQGMEQGHTAVFAYTHARTNTHHHHHHHHQRRTRQCNMATYNCRYAQQSENGEPSRRAGSGSRASAHYQTSYGLQSEYGEPRWARCKLRIREPC